jgi:hypothetical protein
LKKYFLSGKQSAYLLFLSLLILYLLFPSRNNSGDAWGYAAEARYGLNLFSPHHLLYTATLYAVGRIFDTENFLALGILLNGIAGFLALTALYRALKILTSNTKKALLLTACAGLSFGVWRFATENETYIIPILFSLVGSYYFIRSYVKNNLSISDILLSGIFATIACLYHQVHIFWFAGLCIGWTFAADKGRLKRFLIFALTFIIAPLSYFAVIYFYLHQQVSLNNILHFVLHDYYTSIDNKIGSQNFIFGVINFVRTFFQVHGQMRVIISKDVLWLIPGIISAGLLLFAALQVFKETKRKATLSNGEVNPSPLRTDLIFQTHFLIFILQLLFAVYSEGNAEFMIMLPVLLAVIVGQVKITSRALLYSAIALFSWNFCYGIYPNNRFRFNANDKVADFVLKHPADKFILADPAVVFNMIYYQKGSLPQNAWKTPVNFKEHQPLSILTAKIDSSLAQKTTVYTDCTGFPKVESRASMISKDVEKDFFMNYHLIPAETYITNAGMHIIYRVTIL